MNISNAEKDSMIMLTCSDWQQANDPQNDEVFRSLISLIQQGKIIAFYDNDEGCVKYQANQALSNEQPKFYWAYDPE